MKKLRLLFLTLILSGFALGVGAQDTIKGLIFSEHRFGDPHHGYVEIANVGTDTIDLANVTFASVRNQTLIWDVDQWRLPGPVNANQIIKPEGILAPGDTWMWMGVSDRLDPGGFYPDHRIDMLPLADLYIHSGNAFGVTDTIIPEWQMWGDSTSSNGAIGWNWGNIPYVLFSHLANGDSIMIDQVDMALNENNQAVGGWNDVAGIPEATRYNTLVRKYTVKEGNMDWNAQKGATAEDSEWIVLPNQERYSRISYNTIKNHGDFQVDVSSSVVDVDEDNLKMTVPWGFYKGDSILQHLDLGPGMAWQYVEDGDIADSAHVVQQDGDVLVLYGCGNTLDVDSFMIDVLDPAADQVSVFPLRYKVVGGTFWNNPINDQYEWNPDDIWFQYYYVTVGQGVDTIGDVPYATRVDSMLKYLEKAPDASWEIVWKDGEVHADLRNGDMLKVTAADGSTVKEYFIDVQDYAPSDNALLGAITWPDKQDFIENWKGDTIPGFGSLKTSYTVMVPYGTVNVPALVAHPVDINAGLEVERATSLTGSAEARTTTFTVTAASDTIWEVYTVTFELEKHPSKVQIWADATPFFSEHATHQRSTMNYLEIVNPGNSPMDLSEYLIVKSPSVNPAQALEGIVPDMATITDADFQNRYASYVPGFSYHEDTVNWLLEPGILQLDANVNPEVEPGGVFVLGASWANREQYLTDYLREDNDRRWDDVTDEVGVREVNTVPVGIDANAIYLFKITGDSILDGDKAVGDPLDYELVDVLGDPVDDLAWNVAGRNINNGRMRGWIKPKPYIYTGSRSLLECSERWGTHPDTSDWQVATYNIELPHQDNIPDFIGSHVMDPVTVFISTVTSPTYLVSDGYSMEESIQGDLTSTTVEGFFGKVDKADPMQGLTVLSGTDGSEKDDAAAVAGGDTLMVISADSVNMTKYVLVDQPLSSDAVLTLANDPSDLTLAHSGSEGTITGVVYGALLKDLMAEVEVPDLAVMNVIDGEGVLIPMQYMNYDSVKVDTKVGDDVYFEVVAQDLVTVITYKLEPAVLSSDAFVISSIYEVDDESDEISGLYDGTAVGLFFSNIEVVTGATATLYSKLGHERMDGTVVYDDVLKVVSEDGSNTVSYFITFLYEDNPDANSAPEVVLAFSDTTFANPGAIMVSATASDDGLPPPPALTYLWEVTSGAAAEVVIDNADQMSTNVTFNAKGSYQLTLTVSDGALSTQAVVSVSISGVNIQQSLSPAMHIYPNPASDKLNLELTNMPGVSSLVTIFNVTGSAVYNTKLMTDRMVIDVSTFDAGLYFIKVNSGAQTFIRRIEIQ